MRVYVVHLHDLVDKDVSYETVCRTEKDLSDLLANLDLDRYEISFVDVESNYVENYQDLCRKFAGEHGGLGPHTVA